MNNVLMVATIAYLSINPGANLTGSASHSQVRLAAMRPNSSYVPPKGMVPTQGVRTGQLIGCQTDPGMSLETFPKVLPIKLLVPQDHIGQTASGRPVFFWYVSEVPTVPIEFSLTVPGVAAPLFVQRVDIQQPGIAQFQLPEAQPELAIGKKYRWAVSLVCNAADPYLERPYIQSWVERVTPSLPELRQLEVAASERARAVVYAQYGFWYDALATFAAARAANPEDKGITADIVAFLAQAGLSQEQLQPPSQEVVPTPPPPTRTQPQKGK